MLLSLLKGSFKNEAINAVSMLMQNNIIVGNCSTRIFSGTAFIKINNSGSNKVETSMM